MSILISVDQKGARAETVKQLVEESLRAKYPQATIRVTRHEAPESRADRFQEAQSLVSDAKSEMESLRDELQEWYDNLPDNFQQGDKGSQIESAIGELDDVINQCEEVENASVEFPGMY